MAPRDALGGQVKAEDPYRLHDCGRGEVATAQSWTSVADSTVEATLVVGTVHQSFRPFLPSPSPTRL